MNPCIHGQPRDACVACVTRQVSRQLTVSMGGFDGPDPAYSGLDPECVPNDHMVGLRSFRVDELGRLFPVNASNKPWLPGENVCKCKRGGHARVADDGTKYLDQFDPDCLCGFYAFHNGDNSFNGDGNVTAVVKGYGRTVIGTRGFRCEKAEILGVVLPESTSGDPDLSDRWKRRRRWHARGAALWLMTASSGVGAAMIPITSWFTLPSVFVFVGLVAVFLATAVAGYMTWYGYLDEDCPDDGAGVRYHARNYAATGTRAYRRCKCSQGPQKANGSKDQPVSPRTAELIRRNYPSVTSYPSRKAMVKAHPLTPPVEPPVATPDQPDFWERPAKGLRAKA